MNSGELRDLAAGIAAKVLGADPRAVAEAADLSGFPTYTSFRAMDIVEALEQRLGVEVDPGDLVPGKLRSLDSLCAMFAERVR